MSRCPIVVLLAFSVCLLISFLVRPCHVFSKPCLMTLARISVVGINSAACKYCASSGSDFCDIMLFIRADGCLVSMGTSHIPVFLFLVSFIIYCPLLWTAISCLYIVMVHPSSHKNPNKINWAVFIIEKMWIWLACLIRIVSLSVAICEESIVIPSGSLFVISFDIITGDNVVVNFLIGVYLHLSLRLLVCYY